MTHTYATAGDYTVSVVLIDSRGQHPNADTVDVQVMATPVYQFTTSAYTVAEGDTTHDVTVVRVERTGNTDIESSIAVIAGGSTVPVTFAVGDSFKDVPISVAGNTTVEADRQVSLSLANLGVGRAGVTTPTATLAITDDDAAELRLSGVSVNESAGTLDFTVTLSHPAAVDVTVTFDTLDTGTATPGVDFTAIAGQTITFAAGSTTAQIVSVAVTSDLLIESPETVLARIRGLKAGGLNVTIAEASATGTIQSDDVAIDLEGVSASESAGTLEFAVTLSEAVDRDVTVVFDTLTTGTATADVDYTPLAGHTVTIPAGQTRQTFSVTVATDNVVELDETVIARISGIQAGGLSVVTRTPTTTAMIRNDDQATVELIGASASETDGELVFEVRLSNPVDAPVTVRFNTRTGGTATAARDYTALLNQLVMFAANDTAAKTVRVPVLTDDVVESGEIVQAEIVALTSGGRNVVLHTPADSATILDVDAATLSVTDVSKSETDGSTTFTFTLTLSAPVEEQVPVVVNTADGTATAHRWTWDERLPGREQSDRDLQREPEEPDRQRDGQRRRHGRRRRNLLPEPERTDDGGAKRDAPRQSGPRHHPQ